MFKKLAALSAFVLIAGMVLARPASAANVSFNITANSGSANPGLGSFAPGSITVTQGDSVTITFSVPSNDPYCCGAQIKGDGGQFDTGSISPGSSAQAHFTASSSFNFTSYWPGTGTVKAHGSVSVVAPTPTPPGVPTGVAATALSTSQIKVTWASTSGATSYKVQRNSSTIATVSGTEYTDNGLTASTIYAYRIIATNSDGDSSPSALVSATTKATAAASTTPTSQKTTTSTPTTPSSTTATPTTTTEKLFADERNYYATVDSKAFSLDKLPAVSSGQMLKLYGTSVASAKVTLTIEDKEVVSTTAGADGNWQTAVDVSKLAMGKHQAVLGLSANGQQNSKTFTITIANPEAAKKAQKATTYYHTGTDQSFLKKHRTLLISAAAGVALLAAGTALYIFKFKKKPSLPPPTTSTTIPPDNNDINPPLPPSTPPTS